MPFRKAPPPRFSANRRRFAGRAPGLVAGNWPFGPELLITARRAANRARQCRSCRPVRMGMAPDCGRSWIAVTIEPDDDNGERGTRLPCYIFCLPVLPDGRLHFRPQSDEIAGARVWRCLPGRERQPGHLRLIDHQWTCTWDGAGGLADLRLIGASFGRDDLIAVRPGHGPLTVYRVRERTVVRPRPDDFR